MKKLYCIICGKYKKFKNPKIAYIFEKTLVFSIILIKCDTKDEKVFKEEESMKILKVLSLINNIIILEVNLTEENLSQEFRLKYTDKAKIYFLKK